MDIQILPKNITPKQRQVLIYSASAIASISVLSYLFYRYKNRTISSSEVAPKAIPYAISDLPQGQIPALAFVYNPNNDDFDSFVLNFTPAQNPSGGITQSDVAILTQLGVIPKDFPIQNVVRTTSMNDEFSYLVGYSDPYRLKTNRDDIFVVRPLWAVSFGKPIQTDAQAPNDLDSRAFETASLRMLFAEWMLSHDRLTGCHVGQGLNMCDAERAALILAMIERYKIKSDNFTKSGTSPQSVFIGSGQLWNAGDAFKKTFNSTIDQKFVDRFYDFYSRRFWFIPKLTYSATHFIHYLSMSSGGQNPSWVKAPEPFSNDTNYANTHPIHIGLSVLTDQRKTFR
jgi:hypothetical protein